LSPEECANYFAHAGYGVWPTSGRKCSSSALRAEDLPAGLWAARLLLMDEETRSGSVFKAPW